MKKIVGILAVAAVATSLFAADVAAKVRVTGSLFSYDGVSEGITALKAATVSNTYDAPYATLSVNSDNAGATAKFVTGGDGTTDLSVGDVQVWFKPMDMVKVTCGSQDLAMNKETIDWTCTNGFGTFGYSLNVAADALSVNLAFGTDNNGWFFQDGKANGTKAAGKSVDFVKDLYANLAYAADFGTISAMFEYKGKTVKEAEYTASSVKYGAAYKNSIDALTFFVDAVATTTLAESDKDLQALGASDKTLTGATVDAFVQYSQDALTAKAYVKGDVSKFTELGKNEEGKDAGLFDNNNVQVTLKARVDYALDAMGIYAYFGSGNILKKALKEGDEKSSSVFESTIKLGATKSFGACALETWLQLDTGKGGKYDKVNVSMPIYFQVGF